MNIEERRRALYEWLKLLPQRPAAEVARKLKLSVAEVEKGRRESGAAYVEAMLRAEYGLAYTPPDAEKESA